MSLDWETALRVVPLVAGALISLYRLQSLEPRLRSRLKSDSEILSRLDSALSLLVGGARDLPERQRTVRSAIEWSVRLLDEQGKAAFEALSAFSGPFTFEAAEAVLGAEPAIGVFTSMETLIDASLLWQHERDGVQVFGMLVLVRAFAREYGQLPGAAVAASAARERWVSYYVALASHVPERMRGSGQLEWMRRLDAEAENLASVMRYLMDASRFDDAAEYVWSLYLYLWIGGLLGVVRDWMAELLGTAERDGIALAPHTEAIARYFTGAVGYWQDPQLDARPELQRSVDLFDEAGDEAAASLARASLGLAYVAGSTKPDIPSARRILEQGLAGFTAVGDVWGQAMALVPLGRIDLAMGDVGAALQRFQESLNMASTAGELLAIVIAQHHRAWPELFSGDLEAAEEDFAESLDTSLAMRHDEGIAYGLEGLASVRAARGDAEQAGLLLGAAGRLRRRTGIMNPPGFALWHPLMESLRAKGSGDLLDAAILAGADLPVAEVVARVTR